MYISHEMNKHNCQLCKYEFLGRCFKSGEDVSLDNEPCGEYEFAGTEERLHEIESKNLLISGSSSYSDTPTDWGICNYDGWENLWEFTRWFKRCI